MSIKRTKEQKLNKDLAGAYAIIAWLALGEALDHKGWMLVAFLALVAMFAFLAVAHFCDSRKPSGGGS